MSHAALAETSQAAAIADADVPAIVATTSDATTVTGGATAADANVGKDVVDTTKTEQAASGDTTGTKSDSTKADDTKADSTTDTKVDSTKTDSTTDTKADGTTTDTKADSTKTDSTKTDSTKTDSTTTDTKADSTKGDSTTTDTKADATSGALSSQSSSASATTTTPENGIYVITPGTSSNKKLDVTGGSSDNGVPVQIFSDNATIAQRWQLVSVGNGYYAIKSVSSGKYLDVRGGVAKAGTVVQQYAGNGSAAQRWKLIEVSGASGYYRFQTKLSSSLFLDVPGGSSASGTGLQLWTANNTAAQRFKLVEITPAIANGVYTFKNAGSGKVLDVSGGSIDNGGNVQQYAANSTMAQSFSVSYSTTTGYYQVLNVQSGRVLDVQNGGNTSDGNVWQYLSNGSAAQRWWIMKNADGTLTFRSAVNGCVLDVVAGSKANGANVRIYASNGTAAQHFAATKVTNWFADGTYQIIAGNNHSTALAIRSSSTENSGRVVTHYVTSGNTFEKWQVTKGSDGYYTIANVATGLVLDISAAYKGNGGVVQQYASNGSDAQKWLMQIASGGLKVVSKLSSSLVLDLTAGSKAVSTAVQTYTSNNTLAQRFLFKNVSLLDSGTRYTFYSKSDQSYVLDLAGASHDSGAAIQLYKSNGSTAQRFLVVGAGSGYVRLQSAESGKYLTVSGSKVVQQGAKSGTSQLWNVSFDTALNGLKIVSAYVSQCLTNVSSSLKLQSSKESVAQAFLARTPSATLNGIDIASYQAGIDIAGVDADFIIVKSTESTDYTNPYYRSWASQVLSSGKQLGLYHYAEGGDAVAEADYFVASAQQAGVVGKAVLALDWEKQNNSTFGSGNDVAWCLTFLNRVYQRTGVRAVVYMSQSVTNAHDWSAVSNAGYGLWVAQYKNYDTVYGYESNPSHGSTGSWSEPTIYQYTSTGHVSGYGSDLDLDKFYGNVDNWAALARG